MNRILLKADEVSDGGRVVLAGIRARHIAAVLKPAVGDTVRIGILNGAPGHGKLIAVAPNHVELVCQFEAGEPPVPAVDLLLAMPRPKVMKRLWAPLSSMGLGRIIITNAARVERNYFDTHWLDPAHYEPRLIEGLQQAGMTRLPDVTVARRFRPLIEDQLEALSPNTQRIVAHPDAGFSSHAGFATEPSRRLLLAVGPEGGWVPFELALLQAAGFSAVALPFGTLRTDIACIALLAAAGVSRA
ncbi:MAG: 16S rRNA (uracil(1498)-N(3))-methyltransferase [Lentisphaerae bacterium]|nr:16S rRNA (uracil(1498)-N(3))-methyltransferase [Lentisphaerota bacterium]